MNNNPYSSLINIDKIAKLVYSTGNKVSYSISLLRNFVSYFCQFFINEEFR